MKSCLTFLLVLASVLPCMAGGSIGWGDVSTRLSRSAPELLQAINDSFEVAPVGMRFDLVPAALMLSRGGQKSAPEFRPTSSTANPKASQALFFAAPH